MQGGLPGSNELERKVSTSLDTYRMASARTRALQKDLHISYHSRKQGRGGRKPTLAQATLAREELVAYSASLDRVASRTRENKIPLLKEVIAAEVRALDVYVGYLYIQAWLQPLTPFQEDVREEEASTFHFIPI